MIYIEMNFSRLIYDNIEEIYKIYILNEINIILINWIVWQIKYVHNLDTENITNIKNYREKLLDLNYRVQRYRYYWNDEYIKSVKYKKYEILKSIQSLIKCINTIKKNYYLNQHIRRKIDKSNVKLLNLDKFTTQLIQSFI